MTDHVDIERLDRIERKLDLLGALALMSTGRPETVADAEHWRSEWRAFVRGWLDDCPPELGRAARDKASAA